jgi:hypothetical protein
MKTQRIRHHFPIPSLLSAAAASLLLAGAGLAVAANAPPVQAAPSKDTREKMAQMHEQMASCLRSDKPIGECRHEMMQSCQKMMDGKECPMMDMGAMGTMHHGTYDHTGSAPAENSAPK